VCEPLTVGLLEVPQQTPLTVTASPPSFVITPPLEAELMVTSDWVVVVKVGIEVSFLQLFINTAPKHKSTKTKEAIILFMTYYLN
jgi:hypothetical protein